LKPIDSITPELVNTYSEINIKNVKKTINDLQFTQEKILVCGTGTSSHPKFNPRFATPSAMIQADLYVTVDHHKPKKEYFTKKGNYALSLIVHPDVPKKILELNGEIFWFSPQYLKNDLPKIISGVITMDNSGLASISLASHFNAKSILLSGIKLTDSYTKFLKGKKLVFENASKNKMEIFSLDGILATKTTFDEWCKL
jgi:hypothetical protein|tara:strand:- start:125 stop:721 length:597 start_codon:yes stop_codon:yes gene_type:complete